MSPLFFRIAFRIAVGITVAALSLVPVVAPAQQKQLLPGFPSKPIRVIVTTGTGGGLDIITRAVSNKFAERTGANVVVDNQNGASGGIAINQVASLPADGYTLISAGSTLLINAAAGRYQQDVRTLLAPLVRMSSTWYYLIVPVTSPARTFKELIAYAKANPGKLNYGSNGIGSAMHLGLELLEIGAGVDMIHVPYKSSTPMYVDLIGGRIDLTLASLQGVQAVHSGKARLLGVTRLTRFPDLPDVPTIAEMGVPDYEVANTYMLYIHAKTPANIANVLNRELVQAVSQPELKEKMAADGALPGAPLNLAELKAAYAADYARWDGVMKKAGVKIED